MEANTAVCGSQLIVSKSANTEANTAVCGSQLIVSKSANTEANTAVCGRLMMCRMSGQESQLCLNKTLPIYISMHRRKA